MQGNQRVALTKRLLQEGLLRVMERKPLDKINVSELCEESGINRATFYRHYNVPRDVLMELQTQFLERINNTVDIKEQINSPAQYIEQVCNCLYDNSELVKILICNNSYEAIISLFDEFFKKLLSENETVRQTHAYDPTEIELISAYMSGGGYFLLRRWLLDDIAKSPKEITRLVMSFLGQ